MNGKQNFGVFDSMTSSSQRAEPDNISACGCYFWSLIINKVNSLANHDRQCYEPI